MVNLFLNTDTLAYAYGCIKIDSIFFNTVTISFIVRKYITYIYKLDICGDFDDGTKVDTMS